MMEVEIKNRISEKWNFLILGTIDDSFNKDRDILSSIKIRKNQKCQHRNYENIG